MIVNKTRELDERFKNANFKTNTTFMVYDDGSVIDLSTNRTICKLDNLSDYIKDLELVRDIVEEEIGIRF